MMPGGAPPPPPLARGERVRSSLDSLPRDVLFAICGALPAHDVVSSLGCCCRELHHSTASDSLWRQLLHATYQPVIAQAFGGQLPPPRCGLSWRAHFFDFASTWMLRAKEHGRTILTISGHVYDATDYVEDHPGMPSFLLSAAGTDATAVFGLAGHSANARRILARFAAPELDAFQPGRRGERSAGRCGAASSEAAESDAATVSTFPRGGELDSLADDERDGRPAWRHALRVLLALARSPQGRRQILSSAGQLLQAAAVDVERAGRDPRAGEAIQRHLPVVWRLSCAECGALARMLTQPAEPEAAAPPQGRAGRSASGRGAFKEHVDDAFEAALIYAR